MVAYWVWVVDGVLRQRVFLLGPSHHHFTRKCALSTASFYKTPLGDLPIDHEGTVVDLRLVFFTPFIENLQLQCSKLGPLIRVSLF